MLNRYILAISAIVGIELKLFKHADVKKASNKPYLYL